MKKEKRYKKVREKMHSSANRKGEGKGEKTNCVRKLNIRRLPRGQQLITWGICVRVAGKFGRGGPFHGEAEPEGKREEVFFVRGWGGKGGQAFYSGKKLFWRERPVGIQKKGDRKFCCVLPRR